jgi:hypothetical protein
MSAPCSATKPGAFTLSPSFIPRALLLLLLPPSMLCLCLSTGFVDQVDALWDEVEQEVMGHTSR